jgi:hypothetical protein
MRLGLELSKLGIASAVLAAAPQVVQAAPTAITGIQLESRNGGVNLQLQAANGAQLETLKTRYGQTLAIDIINTQLQLAQGEGFRGPLFRAPLKIKFRPIYGKIECSNQD